jgi:hypothetical protein
MTAGGTIASLVSFAALALALALPACGSSNKGAPGGDGGPGGDDSGSYVSLTGDAATIFMTCSAGTNYQCQVQGSCPGGGSTTISGTVYDPAGKNPVYNVAVYVPNTTPAALPSGVSCASCSDLYTTPIASAVTDASGSFTIKNAPDGANIPLVVQVGKWRMTYTLPMVAKCQNNPQTSGMLHLPRNHNEGNIPDIAISTGGADSLECLPLRMGIDPAEYVAGGSTAGRIHIFQGFMGATTAPAAPMAYQGLWDSVADLSKNDITLLSCEGAPTSGGGPQLMPSDQQNLLSYASTGGRVFASHFHYAWFTTGPFAALATPPLVTWTAQTIAGGSATIDDSAPLFGSINSMTAGGSAFPEGMALQAWLGNVNALQSGELPYFYARDNVISSNPPAQVWLTLDSSKLPSNDTSKVSSQNPPQYLSFDLPLGVGTESKCGRVVYSDLHVSGGPGANEPGINGAPAVGADYGVGGSAGTVPKGCALHALTPQEKALEFIFDLSSCLIPIGTTPLAPSTQ